MCVCVQAVFCSDCRYFREVRDRLGVCAVGLRPMGERPTRAGLVDGLMAACPEGERAPGEGRGEVAALSPVSH